MHASALLRNRTPTCLAVVIVRTLALTNPGPPFIARINPTQVRNCRSRHQHGHDLRHAPLSRVHF